MSYIWLPVMTYPNDSDLTDLQTVWMPHCWQNEKPEKRSFVTEPFFRLYGYLYLVNYPSPKGNGLGRLSQKEPISVLQRPCIGSFCIFSLSNYGRIFLYHRKNFYPRTSSHWSMFPKCTACRLSTSTSCGKLFLMIRTPFSLSCFSPPPAMPPMVLSSVKTVPSL